MAYLDLAWLLQSDPTFTAELVALSKEIQRLEPMAKRNTSMQPALERVMMRFIRKCDYNTGLLVPYFFPRYPKEKPLSLNDRPFSFAIFNFQIGGFTVIRASRQIGKEQPYSAKILTPHGWTTMGALHEGDHVVGRDGSPAQVLQIFEQGERDVYRVKFTDESYAECGMDHNWLIRRAGCKHWKTETLRQITERHGPNPSSDLAVRIPLADPIQFPAVSHALHPYVLGALIGDGTLTPAVPRFTTGDPEMLELIQQAMPQLNIKRITRNDFDFADHVRWKRGVVASEIQRLGLKGSVAKTKHIPHEYLFDSVANRIALLRGLMDTDGSIFGKCQMEFYTISPKLAEDVQFLVESLGGTARIREKPAWYRDADGSRVNCSICYRVAIKLQDINPFLLRRKADKFYPIKYKRVRILASVTLVRREQSRCLLVDSTDHTYLTNHCVVTHNSTAFVARQKVLADVFPNYRSMYIVPHQENLDTYANRFREMERVFRFPTMHPQFRQNLTYKEYTNGSVIEMLRILSNANDARGKTTDELLFDEYQHFDDSLIPEVQQTQKASDRPTTIFAGTSLTVDTALESRWLQSSQGTWHLLCECGFEIDCGSAKEVIPLIQPEGPMCPRCSRILDVTRGRWVHPYQGLLDAGWIGLHVPQMIIPDYANNLRKWSEIYQAFCDYDLAKFLQEVFGIATEEGARELTKEDLERMCCLPESMLYLQERARKGYYKWVITGCDWGGSDYIPAFQQKISTTVAATIGVRHDFDIDIIGLRRHQGMGYREITKQIVEDHVRMGGGPIASDFGVGAAYNMLLRENPKVIAERHLIFNYVGPNSALLAPPRKEGAWFNQYSLNRTESITSLYEAIKRQKSREVMEDGVRVVKYYRDPRIRCFNYEQAFPILSDLLNLVRAPTESNLGTTSFKYRRHGSKPDDCLHALNFAYVLARIIIGEPIVEDRGLKTRLETMLRTGILPTLGGRKLPRPYSG